MYASSPFFPRESVRYWVGQFSGAYTGVAVGAGSGFSRRVEVLSVGLSVIVYSGS